MRQFLDAPLGEPERSFEETFSAMTVIKDTFFPGCRPCAAGAKPVKMKRQHVHHDRGTGRIQVCNSSTLKPGCVS